MGPLQQAASSAIQPLAGVFQAPMQGVQSLSSLPSSLMGSTSGMFSSATAQEAAEAEAVAAPLGVSGGGAAGMAISQHYPTAPRLVSRLR